MRGVYNNPWGIWKHELVHCAVHTKSIHAVVMRLCLGLCMGASAFVAMLLLKTGSKRKDDYEKITPRIEAN